MVPLVYFSILIMVPIIVMYVNYSDDANIVSAFTIGYILTALFIQAWYPPLNNINGPLWSTCNHLFLLNLSSHILTDLLLPSSLCS